MDKGPDEARYVRCVKCQKVLHCSRYETSTLIAHIRQDHPEIQVCENGMEQGPAINVDDLEAALAKNRDLEELQGAGKTINFCDDTNCPSQRSSRGKSDARSSTSDHSTNVIYTRRYKLASSSPSGCSSPMPTSRKRRLYRTSIERWRPANGTIYCPKCGLNKRPLIRTRSEKVSDNACGATCLLGCWPFCFLPFLVPGNNKEYLHCANCKNFLGLYDRESNCVRPNREFCDSPCQ